MQQAGVNIRSILTIPLPGHKGIWQIMMRVSTDAFPDAVKTMEGGGYKVLSDYAEDLTPYLP